MLSTRTFQVLAPLIVTILLSLTVLPFAIPPFRSYTIQELSEVILWQAIGVVGWPFALLGALLTLPFGGPAFGILPLALTLTYPVTLLLLFLSLTSRRLHPRKIALMNLLILISFAAVWYSVLNGYDFMSG